MASLIEEKIEAAAIKHCETGTVYAVARPGRHHTVIAMMNEKNVWECDNRTRSHKHGFITNLGHFVNRKEAYKIAKQNGQLTEESIMFEKLSSEDLW